MDIRGKWVCFEDTLELEVFITRCEDLGIERFCGLPLRQRLIFDLDFYKDKTTGFDGKYPCGYLFKNGRIYHVKTYTNIALCRTHLNSKEHNRFRLT